MEKIYIKINDQLKKVLTDRGLNPDEYGPAYGGESAGLDLYYAGENEILIDNTKEYEMTVGKKDKVLIPTGVHVALPKTMVAVIMERGSIIKTDLIRRAGIIDAGYTGEIFVNLVDIGTPLQMGREGTKTYIDSSKTKVIPGTKLPVQLVVIPVNNNYKQVSDEEYENITSNAARKEGSVGSSDNEEK